MKEDTRITFAKNLEGKGKREKGGVDFAKAEKALADAAKSGQDPAEIERLETVVRFAIVQKLAKNRRR